MPGYFRIWKFGADDRGIYSEYTKFENSEKAIKAAKKRLGGLYNVEIWEGACRVWPRQGAQQEYQQRHRRREARNKASEGTPAV